MRDPNSSNYDEDRLALIRENDALRRQLKEKDLLIDSLRREIAKLKAKG